VCVVVGWVVVCGQVCVWCGKVGCGSMGWWARNKLQTVMQQQRNACMKSKGRCATVRQSNWGGGVRVLRGNVKVHRVAARSGGVGWLVWAQRMRNCVYVCGKVVRVNKRKLKAEKAGKCGILAAKAACKYARSERPKPKVELRAQTQQQRASVQLML